MLDIGLSILTMHAFHNSNKYWSDGNRPEMTVVCIRILCFGDRHLGQIHAFFHCDMARLIWPAMRYTTLRLAWRKPQRRDAQTMLALVTVTKYAYCVYFYP